MRGRAGGVIQKVGPVVSRDLFTQHETVVMRELASEVARPEDQVIRFDDDRQFQLFFRAWHLGILRQAFEYRHFLSSTPSGGRRRNRRNKQESRNGIKE